MKIETRKLTDDECVMVLDGISPTMLNSIRRTMIARVARMAIEDVDFHIGPLGFSDDDEIEYESVAPLYDEIIAHRLGMIPVPTDFNIFRTRDECKCGGEGCPLCSIMYSINKRGPCMVYSGDLEPVGGDESTRIKDDLIPIVKLKKGQALLVYCTAEMNTGRDHSKWQATQAVGYHQYPMISIDENICDYGGACVKNCPVDVLEDDGKKIGVKNLEACNQCMTCVEVCEPQDDGRKAIKVDFAENKFTLRYETDSGVNAKEVLIKALRILQNDFDELIDALKTLK